MTVAAVGPWVQVTQRGGGLWQEGKKERKL